MRSWIWRFTLAMSICALTLVTSLNANENPIPRPLKMAGQMQIVVTLPSGSFASTAEGVASHLGAVTMEGSGILAPLPRYSIGICNGIMTAANGDVVQWEGDLVTGIVIAALIAGTGLAHRDAWRILPCISSGRQRSSQRADGT